MSNRRYTKSETYQVHNPDTKRTVMLVIDRDTVTGEVRGARKVWFVNNEIVDRIGEVPPNMLDYCLPFFMGQVESPTWVDGQDQ